MHGTSQPPTEDAEPARQSEPTEFTFVLEQNQSGIRSHAMREYWKRRHERSRSRETASSIPYRPRPLLPNLQTHSQSSSSATSSSSSQPNASAPQQHYGQSVFGAANYAGQEEPMASILEDTTAPAIAGIPAQVLTGVDHALACSRLDPFDMFPVTLTAEHHKLLHHWLSTHATMMFTPLPSASFNPMRDVWFPLDLSNAASFNAIMAHAAAHLARLQGAKTSDEAFKYKAEAVRIVRVWMSDPAFALSDEVFAAVIRLLTFERYWGTDSEWQVHRDGLQHMIEARGGIAGLQSNWRLELVAYLISLMAKPSWFESSNNIFELSEQPISAGMHPLGSLENLRRVRGLWLISFIQDMGTFTSELHGLRQYTAVQDAILLLQADMKRDTLHTPPENVCTPSERARLRCLFFISIVIQASGRRYSASNTSSMDPISPASRTSLDNLAMLNSFLQAQNIWAGTVEDLYTHLFDDFNEVVDSMQVKNYAIQITNVLSSLSAEARRGVERCLLKILCDIGNRTTALEGHWTPDTLLSTLHGL